MTRRKWIAAGLLIMIAATAWAQDPNQPQAQLKPQTPPIRDGFAFLSRPGVVMPAVGETDTGRAWDFLPQEPITDGRGVIQPAAPIPILPSSTLERILANMDPDRRTLGVRLSGRVMMYRGRNYIFPIQFVPTRADEPEPQPVQQPQDPAVDPNDDTVIPQDILQGLLRPQQEVDLRRIKKDLDIEADSILVNRSGLLLGDSEERIFRIDGLGRNISDVDFVVLPSFTLQQTEATLARNPNRHRYRVAGIVTKFRGQHYLLLQRAVRTYTHGNFTQ